jgi:hypothetical protein
VEPVIEELLGPTGLTVGLLFVVFAHFRGWWVRGKDYEKLEVEKNEWKQAALRGITTAERAITLQEKAGPNGPLG